MGCPSRRPHLDTLLRFPETVAESQQHAPVQRRAPANTASAPRDELNRPRAGAFGWSDVWICDPARTSGHVRFHAAFGVQADIQACLLRTSRSMSTRPILFDRERGCHLTQTPGKLVCQRRHVMGLPVPIRSLLTRRLQQIRTLSRDSDSRRGRPAVAFPSGNSGKTLAWRIPANTVCTCSPGRRPAYKPFLTFSGVAIWPTFSGQATSYAMCWCRISRPDWRITNDVCG